MSSGDVKLEGGQPNVEVVMNALLIWAFYAALRLWQGAGWKMAGSVGALLLGVSLLKPYAVVFGASFALSTYGLTNQKRPLALRWLAAAAVVTAGWLLVTAYFGMTGRLGDFYHTIITFNSDYVRASETYHGLWSLLTSSVSPSALRRHLPEGALWIFVPLVISALPALKHRKVTPEGWLLASYLVAAQIAVALPGRLYSHYFQLLLPPLCLAGGAGLAAAGALAWKGIPIGRIFQAVSAGGMAVLALIPLVRGPEWASRLVWGERFISDQRFAAQLHQQLLLPDETFFHWGHETGLYFYSGRRSPTGVVNITGTALGRLRDPLIELTIKDLQQRPPDLIVATKDLLRDGHLPGFLTKTLPAYRPWPADFGPFTLFILEGSGLDRRTPRT
jgi:hypothetical protein